MGMTNLEGLYSYLNDMWLANTPRDSDNPEVKAERNAICTGIDMAMEAVREFAVKNQPRVLTLGEACGVEECWLERRGVRPITVADMAFNGRTDGNDVDSKELNTLREYVFSSVLYGEYWRCWSARPSDEQREATPWTS